jgi:hypothetical protein
LDQWTQFFRENSEQCLVVKEKEFHHIEKKYGTEEGRQRESIIFLFSPDMNHPE